MNRARILAILGYNSFFWFFFWLFAYWTFPYDRLAAYMIDKVAENSSYTLEIGELSPYWLTGVELEDVQVRKQAAAALSAPPATPGAAALDETIRVKSAHARVGLLSLLTGSPAVNFSADLGTGELEGRFQDGGEQQHVTGQIARVDLGKLGALQSMMPLPLKGVMSGDFDLTLAKQPSKTAGTIKLSVQGLTVGDGKAKLQLGMMGGLTIDPVSAGNFELELDVKQGVGSVRKLTTDGADLKLNGSGDVRFAQPLARSRLALMLRLKLTEAYRDKSPRTKTMFSLLEGSTVPQVAAAKSADGSYQLRVSGTLSSARVLPAGQRGTPAAGGINMPALPPGDEEE